MQHHNDALLCSLIRYKKNRRGTLQKRVFVLFSDCLFYCKSAVTLSDPMTNQFPITLSVVDTTSRPQDYAQG